MLETIRRIQNGENKLINELILAKEEFIYSFIEKYKNIFDDYEELKQEALCSYIYLIKNYNFKGYFSIYITTKMNDLITRYILSNLERISNIDDRIKISKYFYNRSIKYFNHEPTLMELRQYLKIKNVYIEQIYNYATHKRNLISYKEGICGNVDEKYELIERNIDNNLFIEIIKNHLTKKKAEAIILKYGFYASPKSFVEIGRMENTSRQTIFDRVENGKDKLRKILEKKEEEEW